MKDLTNKAHGQKLQMLRQQRNLTQEQMGEKLGLSTSAYCKIEYGETDLTLSRLQRIADILGMSCLQLFRFITDSEKDAEPSDKELDSLRELLKAANRTVDQLSRRVDQLEQLTARLTEAIMPKD
ncbi:MAG: helix-turn-helix transcriptional regulator [Bacteroides sp.]|nr:helix-turn-helix transcriptional regulator [Bacteroides sp.]